MSLRRLGLERIDLWQLHRIDRNVAREEHFQVIADMRREGLIRHVGLSEVSVEEIQAAPAVSSGGERTKPVQPHHAAEWRNY